MGRTSKRHWLGAGAVSTLRLGFEDNTSRAAASNDGATTTSVNTGANASAIAAVTGRFAATIPPNALTGSQAFARA